MSIHLDKSVHVKPDIGNSPKIPAMISKETENVSNSFLHRYYVNVMENTEQSSVKVERATKFLLLPEISKLVGDHTKAMFLLSKGLTHDEVSEAFKHYYKKQKEKLIPSVPELVLHNVNQIESNPQNAIQVRYPHNTRSGLSIFFNLCQRMIFLAGISTAVYYLYQKWRANRARDDSTKKEHKRIEEELNHIKSELLKISADLKAQQLAGKTNANILTEISSLKAILVSRQYFEEKQNTKLSLPSWQLNGAASTSDSCTNEKGNISATDKNPSIIFCNNRGNVTKSISKDSSSSSEQNISSAEKITLNENNNGASEINGGTSKLVKGSPSSSEENIQPVEKITPPFKQNGDAKSQMNGDAEEKEITNGECISDTPPKTKKNGSKNKSSKSRMSENGNKNIQKQNGAVRVNID